MVMGVPEDGSFWHSFYSALERSIPWHCPCSPLGYEAMLTTDHITNLPATIGFTWKKLLLLAVVGVATGLVFALTMRLPVS